MYLVHLSTPVLTDWTVLRQVFTSLQYTVLTDWTVLSCQLLLTAGTHLAAKSISVLLFHHFEPAGANAWTTVKWTVQLKCLQNWEGSLHGWKYFVQWCAVHRKGYTMHMIRVFEFAKDIFDTVIFIKSAQVAPVNDEGQRWWSGQQFLKGAQELQTRDTPKRARDSNKTCHHLWQMCDNVYHQFCG